MRSSITRLLGYASLVASIALSQGLSSCQEEGYTTEVLTPSKTELTLAPGETATVEANKKDGQKALAIIWSVRPVDLASINGNGEVTALRSGQGEVVGQYGTGEVRIPLTVLSQDDALQVTRSITDELREEETMQLRATLKGEQVTPTYSSDNQAVATVDEEGIVTGISAGTAIITAKHGERTTDIRVKVRAISFLLPYLKLYNTPDHIIEYETARGHTASIDAELGSIHVTTTNKDFPGIVYYAGARAQLFPSDPFVMTTKKFAAFMATQGFVANPTVYPWYTYTTYTNSKYKTVSFFSVTKAQPAYRNLEGLSMQVVAQPAFALPYPQLDWDSTVDQIKAYEASQGRTLNSDVVRSNTGNRTIIFSKKTDTSEYTELFGTYYIFNRDGQLVQQDMVIAPAGLVLGNVATESFTILDTTLATLQADGYVKDGNYKNGVTNVDVFKNNDRGLKLILGTMSANVSGYRTMMARFRFTRLSDTTYDYEEG